jgi:hypothetical protein
VGISTVFEIFGHYLNQGDGITPIIPWPTYHQMFLDTKTRICMVEGWGSQQFSNNLGTSCLRGDRTTLYSHDLHTIWWSFAHRTRILFRGGEFNGFQDIKISSLLCPDPTPGDDDIKKTTAFVPYLKTFMWIWALWAHWFLWKRSFKDVPNTKGKQM